MTSLDCITTGASLFKNGSTDGQRQPKLTSWDLYRSMGSPKFIVAPMVDQSELAWRILSRIHGADHAYTPMIHAGLFSNSQNERYQREQFDFESGEEGKHVLDRPVTAQFCANNKETFLTAARRIAESGDLVDAVDLNLGCPQGIAKRGQYGAFLMEDWGLIESMISHLNANLSVPITAKFRVYDTLDKTLEYAKILERAGAQILTVHGRTRDQKGQLTGLADWEKIRAVKQAVSVPVFANGNILTHLDVKDCLERTGVDGIMSAEGNLYNPAVFEPLNRDGAARYRAALPPELLDMLDSVDAGYTACPNIAYYPLVQMSRQYLAIVASLKTTTGLSAVKAHLFRMWKPVFNAGRHLHFREDLSRISNVAHGRDEWKIALDKYVALTHELEKALESDYAAGYLSHDPHVGLPEDYARRTVPYSHAQAYLRPLSEEDASVVSKQSSSAGMKRDLGELQRDEDAKLDGEGGSGSAKVTRVGVERDAIKMLPVTVGCTGCDSVNNASARCVRGMCRACCGKVGGENEDGLGECAAHAAKERKEEEKRLQRKLIKEAKAVRRREGKRASVHLI